MADLRIREFMLHAGEGNRSIKMPKGAVVLEVRNVFGGAIRLFAVVDDEQAETEERRFVGYATGESLGESIGTRIYVGSATSQPFDGVVHFYEDRSREN